MADFRYIIIVGEGTGPREYVGTFAGPIAASNYAEKHFKGKRWVIDGITIIRE